MKNFFILIVLLFKYLDFFSQPVAFYKGYAGAYTDYFYSGQQTTDGGFIIGGIFNNSSFGLSSDGCLIKTNAQGDTLWTRMYGGSEYEEFTDVIQTQDNGYIAVGRTYSFDIDSGDAYVVKININGDTLWTRVIGSSSPERASSVCQTSDGGYLVAGNNEIIKLDMNGNVLWSKKTDFSTAIKKAIQTFDNGYVILGEFNSGLSERNILVIKLNTNGDVLWAKRYAGFDNLGFSIKEKPDKGFVVAGKTGSPYYNGLALFLDSVGSGWSQMYQSVAWITSVDVLNGGYVFTGFTYSIGAGNSDACLIKTGASGNVIWSRVYGNNLYDFSNQVYQTTDGGFAMIGYSSVSMPGPADFLLIKTDSAGFVQCNTSSASIIDSSSAYLWTTAVSVQTINVGFTANGTNTIISSGTTISTDCPNDIEKNENLLSKELLMVFPNPASGSVSVTASGGDEIIITDIAGREIKRMKNFQSSLSFSIDGIENGIYFISLYKNNSITNVQKLIKTE